MPKLDLTQRLVETWALPSQARGVDLHDARLPGLLLKVFASGRRSWYVRYRLPRRGFTERKFADARVLSLREARECARSLLAAIALGDDPFAAQDAARMVLRFSEFVERHYLPHIQISKKSWKTDVSILNNHLLPEFGRLYFDEIVAEGIQAFIAKKSKQMKPASCNRVLILLRYLLNCAIEWKTPGITENPAKGIHTLAENNGRERFLTQAETYRLLKELDRSSAVRLKDIILMLVFTGARKSEVLLAQWSHINFEQKIWLIPENKSGKPRYVPLSDQVLHLLGSIREENRPSTYIFANPATGRPYVSIFKAWDLVRTRAGLPDVRIHDLRHSFASFLINQGRSLYEVQKILGHSQVRTTQRYAHLDQKRLLEAVNSVPVRIDAVED